MDSEVKQQARENEIKAQRNLAYDMVANACGVIAELNAALGAAQAEIAELKKPKTKPAKPA